MLFYAGTAFQIVVDPHLWVIISDPPTDPENVIQVNFTTLRDDAPIHDPRNDRSCVVMPGDHPFIQHPTCVYYAGTQVTTVPHLEWRHRKGNLRLRDPVNAKLLERIRQGAMRSEHCTPLACEILENQGLV